MAGPSFARVGDFADERSGHEDVLQMESAKTNLQPSRGFFEKQECYPVVYCKQICASTNPSCMNVELLFCCKYIEY